jgi:hypothetical protein
MQDDSGDSSSGNNDDGGRGGGLKEEGATKGGAGSITSEMASLRLSRRVDIVRCSLSRPPHLCAFSFAVCEP